MPATITPYLIGVWTAVGFFTGLGWDIAGVLVARLFAHCC